MTQDPSYPPPADPTLNYQPVLPPDQPGSIRALSIVAICLGGLFTLCGAAGVAMLAVNSVAGASGKPNPFAPAATPPPPALAAYQLISAVINLLLSVVELAFGIGGLGLKAWARLVGVAWSIVSILWAVAATAIALVWAGPLAMKSQPANPFFSSGMGSKFIVIGTLVSLVFCCIVPSLILIFWTRPNVKSAFEQSAVVPNY